MQTIIFDRVFFFDDFKAELSEEHFLANVISRINESLVSVNKSERNEKKYEVKCDAEIFLYTQKRSQTNQRKYEPVKISYLLKPGGEQPEKKVEEIDWYLVTEKSEESKFSEEVVDEINFANCLVFCDFAWLFTEPFEAPYALKNYLKSSLEDKIDENKKAMIIVLYSSVSVSDAAKWIDNILEGDELLYNEGQKPIKGFLGANLVLSLRYTNTIELLNSIGYYFKKNGVGGNVTI